MKEDTSKKGEEACISHAVSSAGGVPEMTEGDMAEFIEKNGRLPPKDALDDYFKLEKKGPWRWEWHKKLQAPGSRSHVHHYDIQYSEAPVYRKYVTESEVRIVVTREDVDGVPGMLVDVSTVFDHWEGYFNNDHFAWGSNAGTDQVLWGSYSIKTNWQMRVKLANSTTSNGIMVPTLTGYDPTTFKPSVFSSKVTMSQYMRYGEENNVRQNIEAAVGVAIRRLVEGLSSRFDGSGQFVYPGSGTFKFGEPHVTEQGHVWADIEYLPLPEGRVKLAIPRMPPVNPNVPRHEPSSGEISSRTKQTKTPPSIKWSPSVTWDPVAKRAKLVLVATKRAATNAVAFSRVKLSVRRDIRGNKLFIHQKWEDAKAVEARLAAEEEAERVAAEKEKAEREAAEGKKKADQEKADEAAKKKKDKEDADKKAQDADKRVGGGGKGKGKGKTNKRPALEWTAVEGGAGPDTDGPEQTLSEEEEAGPETADVPESTPAETPSAPSDPPSHSLSLSFWNPKPKPPPADTYSITHTNIARGTYVKGLSVYPDVQGGESLLEFSILPEGDFELLKKRFVLSDDSSFTFTLEGAVEKAGTYVLQLNESLQAVVMSQTLSRAVFANTWLVVTLEEGSVVGKVEEVDHETAQDILGLPPVK